MDNITIVKLHILAFRFTFVTQTSYAMISRIEEIIRYKGLTASKFADEVGVQRSGISHILSGRNKPSLEFILKILDTWPEINTDWLLKGHGKMLRNQNDLFSLAGKPQEKEPEAEIKKTEISRAPLTSEKQKKEETPAISASETEIEKIIILYKDKSFKEYGSSR